jgi:hypothetical protein
MPMNAEKKLFNYAKRHFTIELCGRVTDELRIGLDDSDEEVVADLIE